MQSAVGYQTSSFDFKLFCLNMNRLFERNTLIKMDGSFNMLIHYLQKNALIIMNDFGLISFDPNLRVVL